METYYLTQRCCFLCLPALCDVSSYCYAYAHLIYDLYQPI